MKRSIRTSSKLTRWLFQIILTLIRNYPPKVVRIHSSFETIIAISHTYIETGWDADPEGNLRVAGESTGLLSVQSYSHQSSKSTVQGDGEAKETSYTEEGSTSDISSVYVPFYEHIKAARRAGNLHKSALLSHQKPIEEEQWASSRLSGSLRGFSPGRRCAKASRRLVIVLPIGFCNGEWWIGLDSGDFFWF